MPKRVLFPKVIHLEIKHRHRCGADRQDCSSCPTARALAELYPPPAYGVMVGASKCEIYETRPGATIPSPSFKKLAIYDCPKKLNFAIMAYDHNKGFKLGTYRLRRRVP